MSPEGEGFGHVESLRGEFALCAVSDTTSRVHYRNPGFTNLQPLQEVVPGYHLPDIFPILATIDLVSVVWGKQSVKRSVQSMSGWGKQACRKRTLEKQVSHR